MCQTVGILLLSVCRLFPRCEPSSVKGERHNLYCTLIRHDQSKLDIEFCLSQRGTLAVQGPSLAGRSPAIKLFLTNLSILETGPAIVHLMRKP